MTQSKLNQFIRVCRKAKNDRAATRVWNWVDCRTEDCEHLFAILRLVAPWAFKDVNDANSIRFTY